MSLTGRDVDLVINAAQYANNVQVYKYQKNAQAMAQAGAQQAAQEEEEKPSRHRAAGQR